MCIITLDTRIVLLCTLAMPLQHTWPSMFLTSLAMLLSMRLSLLTLLWLNGATNVAISLLTTLRCILLVDPLTVRTSLTCLCSRLGPKLRTVLDSSPVVRYVQLVSWWNLLKQNMLPRSVTTSGPSLRI